MIKGDAGRSEPWVPLGTSSENRTQATGIGGLDGEASELSKKRRGLTMPIQFPVWHEGAPNIRERTIKKGLRRRALNNSTLRTP